MRGRKESAEHFQKETETKMFLSGYKEYSEILSGAQQLRTCMYNSYGSPDDPNFQKTQELQQNSTAMQLIVHIRKQIVELDQKWRRLTDIQLLELDFLKMCFEQVACYIGRGSIDLLHSAVEMFVKNLEIGNN